MEQSAGNRIKHVNSVFMPKREPRSSCVPTIVSSGFCRPRLSEGVRTLGRSSGAIEQHPTKSSTSRLPLRWLELPCAVRNASDFQLCQNFPVRTTSSAGRQKRRDDE